MPTLSEILLTPERKPQVAADCLALIDAELAGKSGISGGALKLAFRTVNGFASGYVRQRVESILPQAVSELEPYWASFQQEGGGKFGDYLAARGPKVADDLLSITDNMAQRSTNAVVVRSYKTVRGGAAKHVQAALPRVGELVHKYAA